MIHFGYKYFKDSIFFYRITNHAFNASIDIWSIQE